MQPPEARLRVGAADLHLLGTVAGFVPDGERVRAAFEADRPDAVALGVPPEDVEGLRHLAKEPDAELPEPDPQTARLFELLAPYGACRVPSPDLEAAFAAAQAADVPVEALDMDDEAHSHVYIRKVGFLQAVRSGRILRRILEADFSKHDDPYALARAWDAYQNQQKVLKEVEAAREAHMAQRLRDVAAGRSRLLAVLPVARLDGVVRRLRGEPDDAAEAVGADAGGKGGDAAGGKAGDAAGGKAGDAAGGAGPDAGTRAGGIPSDATAKAGRGGAQGSRWRRARRQRARP